MNSCLKIFLFIGLSSQLISSDFVSGRLPNGITYFIHNNTTSKEVISFDLIVRAGSLSEKEDEKGYSHLVEHLIADEMKFKGIKITDEACPIWDLSYPTIDEFVSYRFTQYHLDIPIFPLENIEEGLKSLSSIFTITSFSESDVTTHENEILKELSESDEMPTAKWARERIGYEYAAYKTKHPLCKPSPSNAQRLYRFYSKWYHPENCALVIISSIEPRLIAPLLEQSFSSLPSKGSFTPPEQNNKTSLPGLGTYTDPQLGQTEFTLLKEIPPLSHQEQLEFALWLQLLNDYLKTYFSTYHPQLEIVTDPALLRLKIIPPQDQVVNVLFELDSLLYLFENLSLTPDQLDIVKTRLKEGLKSQLQNNLYLSNHYRSVFLEGTSIDLPSEKMIDSLSLDSFQSAVKKFHTFSKAVIAAKEKGYDSQ